MQRKQTEGSKGGTSKHVRPDKLDPSKRATCNTDIESLAGGRDKGSG